MKKSNHHNEGMSQKGQTLMSKFSREHKLSSAATGGINGPNALITDDKRKRTTISPGNIEEIRMRSAYMNFRNRRSRMVKMNDNFSQ